MSGHTISRRLSPSQLNIIKLIYIHRFVSVQLLSELLKVKHTSGVRVKLESLVSYGVLGKRYDKSYHLRAKPAAYYLLPLGLRVLNDQTELKFQDATIKASYRDKTVSETFIDHNLAVVNIYLSLQGQYPDIKLFTKRQLDSYDYFPSMLPDLFVSLKTVDQTPQRFFLDLVSDSYAKFALDKRLNNYHEFFESGSWDVTNSPEPNILLVSEWGLAELRIQRQVQAIINRLDADELHFYSTTFEALINNINAQVWTTLEDRDMLLDLTQISENW